MTDEAGRDGGKARRVCAAVGLYRPDAALLRRLAEGLAGLRLIAVANGPLAPEAAGALAGADLRRIDLATNIGLGAGLNAAARTAAGEGYSHVLLLDQDSEPAPGLASALLREAKRLDAAGRRAGVVAPLLTPPEGYRAMRYAWREAGAEAAAVDFAPTSGSLLDLAAYREVGPFRDDFFIAGLDVEWGFRAWSRGWGSYVAKRLAMPHRWGEADESDRPQILRHAPIRNYYYARNVLATARLAHVPLAWKARSCATLAAQIAILAAKGAPGALAPVRAGLRDGALGRMGPAPEGFGRARVAAKGATG